MVKTNNKSSQLLTSQEIESKLPNTLLHSLSPAPHVCDNLYSYLEENWNLSEALTYYLLRLNLFINCTEDKGRGLQSYFDLVLLMLIGNVFMIGEGIAHS